jgi:hypothetical protein
VSLLASFRRALRVTVPCENLTEFRCARSRYGQQATSVYKVLSQSLQ